MVAARPMTRPPGTSAAQSSPPCAGWSCPVAESPTAQQRPGFNGSVGPLPLEVLGSIFLAGPKLIYHFCVGWSKMLVKHAFHMFLIPCFD